MRILTVLLLALLLSGLTAWGAPAPLPRPPRPAPAPPTVVGLWDMGWPSTRDGQMLRGRMYFGSDGEQVGGDVETDRRPAHHARHDS